MFVSVRNGTNAGWKKVRQAMKHDWKCPSCRSFNRYYWTSCPNCKHPRD